MTIGSVPQVNSELMSKQLRDILLKEMRVGVFKKAEKLPSEEEMSKLFNVSRSVIRDTMLDMEKDGFVLRIRGVGTIINHHVLTNKARLDWEIDYHTVLEEAGVTNVSVKSKMEIVKSDLHTSQELSINVNTEMIACEKQVFAGDEAVILFTDIFAKSHMKNAVLADIDWDLSVFSILEYYNQASIILSLAHIEAVIATPLLMEKFNVTEKTPFLFLESIGFNKTGQPIVLSNVYYKSGILNFSILRKKR